MINVNAAITALLTDRQPTQTFFPVNCSIFQYCLVYLHVSLLVQQKPIVVTSHHCFSDAGHKYIYIFVN